MSRRSSSQEFKFAAVRLVNDRGLTVALAGRDLHLHENVSRKWVRQYRDDPAQAFPGAGQMKLWHAEVIWRLVNPKQQSPIYTEIADIACSREFIARQSAFD